MRKNVKNHQRQVFVVDDDPDSVIMVKSALEWEGYEVQTASSGEEAVERLKSWSPHLILLDINMPGFNGLETLKFLRSKPEYVSTIFVSGQSKPSDVIKGLDSGADDYVTKPFDIKELMARVRAQLRIKDLQDELKLANEKLKLQVEVDDLTGLFNMRSLYSRLDHELERARRYSRSVAVVMMDMDNFKNVNDEHDHLFGSFVLSEVGRLIRENIRKVDFGARYGGDEFLMVLTEIDLNGAKLFTERLRKTIENFEFKNDKHSRRITSSLGFAITRAEGSKIDARSLVRIADRALYDAKEGGRNCVSFVDMAKSEKDEVVPPSELVNKND